MVQPVHRYRLERLLQQLSPAPAAAAAAAAAVARAPPPSDRRVFDLDPDPYPQMTDTDKFRFDTQGFITIEGVLSAEELRLLNEAFDENQHLSEEDENHGPLQRDGHNEHIQAFHEETQRRQVFWGMLEWPRPYCQPFRELLCHPKVMPYLNTMMGPGWKMDHSPFMLCGGEGSTGLTLHGGTSRNPFQVNGYSYANDRMSCGMVVVAFQLHDVNEGDGGLAVVPGSHKSNYEMPPGLRYMEELTDMIHNPPAKAGDVIIFLEATIHGTIPWSNPNHERRSLLYRYTSKFMHHSGGTWTTVQPEWLRELTRAQRAVLEPPYINNRPTVRSDLTEEYSFNPRINEHKPVEYRKKVQRDAMEEAAAQWLHQHAPVSADGED